MDILLSKVTQQAMNYAVRTGITLATSYTLKQCGRLLEQTPKSQEREEIARLQPRLESKIHIISPAIDMIALISARGHTTLESAISLTNSIRLSIQELGTQLRKAAEEEVLCQRNSKRAHSKEDARRHLQGIVKQMQALVDKIDDAVPLVNLAITTSGVNLSSKLSAAVSPSRLLQASTFVTAADAAYASGLYAQVGPTFVVSVYMLFAGHASRAVEMRDTTWKEVLHKAHVKLIRTPIEECGQLSLSGQNTTGFAYHIVLIEDYDDGRVHTVDLDEPQPSAVHGVLMAGIREVIPVHQIAKLFYADTGKILNIRGDGEENTPILLLKRDIDAHPPTFMHETPPRSQEISQACVDAVWKLPCDLDPEWLALEVYDAGEDSDDDVYDDGNVDSTRSSVTTAFSSISIPHRSSSPKSSPLQASINRQEPVKTSLSLLEMLIKLTSLQQFRQTSHLAIEDELLNFFLEESATAGAGGDKIRRQKVRQHAIQKVGFDPYDESPIKRRTEAYIARPGRETADQTLQIMHSIDRSSTPDSVQQNSDIEQLSPCPSALYEKYPSRRSTPDKTTAEVKL